MNIMALLSQFNQFKKNPMAMLSKRFNIPQGMNDPNDIINHLMQTNQINQNQLNQIQQMANMFRS